MGRVLHPASRAVALTPPLPLEFLDDARNRLGIAVLGIGVVILGSASWMAYIRLSGRGHCPPLHFGIYAIAIVSAVTVYLLTKREEISTEKLVNLGLLFQVGVAFCIALLEGTTSSSHGRMSGLSWVTILIVFFPVVVQAAPLKTVAASAGAAVSGQLAGWWTSGSPDHLLMWNNTVAVALSLIPSLIVSRLGHQIGEALEFGQYVLEQKLGEGAMGEVWRASHRLLARPAAIKLVHRDLLAVTGREDWKSLLKEARTTAQLTSPHSVTVFDFGESKDGRFYCAMELLEGQDLRQFVKDHGPLEPSRAVSILMQACLSLEEAHERGLIHRDIKPSNLFLCRAGMVEDYLKILDFGLAIGNGVSRRSPVEQSEAFGTPEYIAPEQARGAPIDGRADLYALAGVGYWLLTGQPVFPGRSRAEALMSQLNEQPPPVTSRVRRGAISPRLEAILLSCLQKDPDKRPSDARALREQLSFCPEAGRHKERNK